MRSPHNAADHHREFNIVRSPGQLPARGSLRSGRAGLPHPTPRRMRSLRDMVNDHRRRERVALEQSREALPRHRATNTPPCEPLAPHPLHLVTEGLPS